MHRIATRADSGGSNPWIRFGPWVVAGALLALLIGQASPSEIIGSARGARLDLFLILVLVACGLWFLLESAALTMLFRRFNPPSRGAPLSWSEARAARGATYLLTPIHWNVGRVGLILHLGRSKEIPILEATSTLFYQQCVDAWLLVGCAGIGLAWLPPSPEHAFLMRVCGVLFVSISALCLLIASSVPQWSWLDRIRRSRFLRTHRLARPADFFGLALLKGAYYAVFIVVYSWGTAAFGLDLSLALVIASVPIIQMVGSIPITPAGLGTQQAAMLYLFSGSGPESAIIAFGLIFPLVQTIARCLIGLPYLANLDALQRHSQTPRSGPAAVRDAPNTG